MKTFLMIKTCELGNDPLGAYVINESLGSRQRLCSGRTTVGTLFQTEYTPPPTVLSIGLLVIRLFKVFRCVVHASRWTGGVGRRPGDLSVK